MSELCEWNPRTNRPATFENGQHTGCQNEATMSVGMVSNWHLCTSCAELPPFRRMTARVPLRQQAQRPDEEDRRSDERVAAGADDSLTPKVIQHDPS